MPQPEHVTVVVSTYNNPRALAFVLAGLARQSASQFELIVADDGSGPETRAVVESFASGARQSVRHLWHADDGVRRNTILNKAILAASGDYLVFLDGDCVPPPQWLAAHLASAAPGWFVSGGKVLLSERQTQDVFSGAAEITRVHQGPHAWTNRKNRRLMMSRIPIVRDLLDFNRRQRCGWVGEDSSTFATHIHEIGGFDERFTLVWDDADFSERLKASGVRGRSIRYRAPVLHLEHGRGYRTDEDVSRNLDLFLANRAASLVITEHGLALHRRGPGSDDEPIASRSISA